MTTDQIIQLRTLAIKYHQATIKAQNAPNKPKDFTMPVHVGEFDAFLSLVFLAATAAEHPPK